MAVNTSEGNIEATLGRFFNTQELAARPEPDLYTQAAEFHAANTDIIAGPRSLIAGLTLDEAGDTLRHEQFLVGAMSRRTVWLGIDTSKPSEAYEFNVAGMNERGVTHRYDVTAHADGARVISHFELDGQGSLLRRQKLTDFAAIVTVCRAVDLLLTHPETERVLAETRSMRDKTTARVAEFVMKQENGVKLSGDEKKAVKAAQGGGLLATSWRPLDDVLPRVG